MNLAETFSDTRPLDYDTSKFNEFNSIILAMRELGGELRDISENPLQPFSRINTTILEWLNEDRCNNPHLFEAYTLLSSRAINSDTWFDYWALSPSPEQADFECEISALASSLLSLNTLEKDEITMELARRVALIDAQSDDIEEWANLLAGDISLAKD